MAAFTPASGNPCRLAGIERPARRLRAESSDCRSTRFLTCTTKRRSMTFMGSRAHVIVIVAALLWCPFRCLEAAASMASSERPDSVATSPARCSCCHPRTVDGTQDSSRPAPVEHSSRCECPDCVCAGAIVDCREETGGIADSAPPNVVASAVLAHDASLQQPVDDGYRHVWKSFTPSGRDIVILHRNLRR